MGDSLPMSFFETILSDATVGGELDLSDDFPIEEKLDDLSDEDSELFGGFVESESDDDIIVFRDSVQRSISDNLDFEVFMDADGGRPDLTAEEETRAHPESLPEFEEWIVRKPASEPKKKHRPSKEAAIGGLYSIMSEIAETAAF